MVKVKKVTEAIESATQASEDTKNMKMEKEVKSVATIESDAEADGGSSQESVTVTKHARVKEGRVKKEFPKIRTKHIHTLPKRNTQVLALTSLASSSTTMIQSQLPLVATQLKSWRDMEKYEENPIIDMLRHQVSMQRLVVLKDRSSNALTYVDLDELIAATEELAEGYKAMNEEEK